MVLLVVVVIALPIAFRSMGVQLNDSQVRTLYTFPEGAPLTAQTVMDESKSESFYNVAAINIDEGAGTMTLAVSGQRTCRATCPTMQFHLVSLDDDADIRRALPPSVPMEVESSDQIFSGTAELPLRGQPSKYPFDDYVLWLGIYGTRTDGGVTKRLTEESIRGHAFLTVQNQLRDFTMRTPIEIDPDRVQANTDVYDFFGVQELHFERPIHMKILTVLLLLLITVSALTAVAMRDVRDLIVGVGSLVIGIWGVRSILVPQPIPVVTGVDLSLSVVILFVLLGLLLRTAQHLQRTAELPPDLPFVGRHDRPS
ncbi:MAG: hypothetical protein R2853_06570 [Thermomicrobiales bacterium]|nr:hypothetical protein [Thermomicrobiales bacterium]